LFHSSLLINIFSLHCPSCYSLNSLLTEEFVIYFTNCFLQNTKEIKAEEPNEGWKKEGKE
jgi:hypothetical protein